MKLAQLPRKVARGLPYLGKEVRSIISDRTPFFIARPRVVHIWRGAPCNAKCIMCGYAFLKGDPLREITTSPFKDEMISRAIPQIAELCGRGTMVSYMGGEPTVSRHLLEWVETASRLGLDFRFTTNGYRVTPEMAEKLVAAGLFNLGVSLESLDPKINEVMRPHPLGTELTVRAIELLLKERRRQKKYVTVNIKTVISNINMGSFLDIAKRWGKEDGVMVTPQAFEGAEGMPQATKDLLFIKDLRQLEEWAEEVRRMKKEGYNIHITEQALQEFLKLYRDDKNHEATMHNKSLEMDPSEPECNIGTDNLWIDNGYVKLCPYHPPIGNFITGTQTLKELWESEQCRRVREGTRACRRLCNISCLRRTPLRHKVQTFLRIA